MGLERFYKIQNEGNELLIEERMLCRQNKLLITEETRLGFEVICEIQGDSLGIIRQ